MTIIEKVKNKGPNLLFLGLFFLLIIVGLVVLWSASVVKGEVEYADKYYFVKQQLIKGIIPGIVIFFGFYFIKYKNIKKYVGVLFLVSCVLLILVLIMGTEIGGSRSWLFLASGLPGFQPSEIIKLAQIAFLAMYFEKIDKNIKTVNEGLLPFLFIFGIPAFLIFLQPDLGTLIIFFAICISMFFSAGAKIRHVASIVLITLLAVFIMLKIDKGTRLERIDIFLNPEKYSEQGDGYHIKQSLIAVGSGGILGRGIGKSVQKFSYLPEVVGDSIFAIMAEELGFIMTSAVLFLFFMFLYQCVKIAKRAPDKFSSYFVIGFVSWIGFQVFVNVGAMIRLSPLTGVPLPFMSLGGTSMWVICAACGTIFNISKYTVEEEGSQKKKRSIL